MNINQIEMDRYEADDIAGTLAKVGGRRRYGGNLSYRRQGLFTISF